MNNREKNNFYAVPLIGGILCIYAIFGTNLFIIPLFLPGSTVFNPPGFLFILIIIGLSPIILNLIFGILMIVTAGKLKKGKKTLIEEKKKLLTYSWVVVSASLVASVFSIYGYRTFLFLHEPGLVGGLIIILGNFYYNRINKGNSMIGPPLIRDGEKIETGPMKEQIHIIYHTFCNNCGYKSKDESLKFCPKCGNKLI